MENKIIAIEIGTGYQYEQEKINFVENWTTNKNYIGFDKELNVPIYINKKLQIKEKKIIMENNYQTLPAGSYTARVEQVIRKTNKDDANKKIVSLELNVKDHDEKFYYINFCVEGYSERCCEVSNQIINEMCEDFGVNVIDELVNKEGTLTVSAAGNMKFITPKKFFDWTKIMMFPCEAKFPCVVKKLYQSNRTDTMYIFIVEVDVNGQKHDEYVSYDTTNEYRNNSLTFLISKFGLTGPTDEINKPAFLFVKRVDKEGNIYINKRIGFEKKATRKPAKWGN